MRKGMGSSLRSREQVEQVQAEPRQGNVLVKIPAPNLWESSELGQVPETPCWSLAQGAQ